MYIYDAGNKIVCCGSKSIRIREAQKEVDRLPSGTEVLVHFGVRRDEEDEMCEGKKFISKREGK